MKQAYISKSFRDASLDLIDEANDIIREYADQGFDLTLRQLFYQLVSRDIIPNTQRSYKNLGNLISDARLAGLIDWLAIVDRTRNLRRNPHWSSPESIMRSAASSYAIDKWRGQANRVEVWVEKDALIGVIAQACEPLDVPYFSCRGYTSQSELWTAAQRLMGYIGQDQTPTILHLGDHDPSGIDMTRDITDRLQLFMGDDFLRVERIALNWEHIEQYTPPPNPAKLTDTRADAYIAEYGRSSWELDALSPVQISDLINAAVLTYRNPVAWAAAEEEEEDGRAQLWAFAERLEWENGN